MSIKRSIPFEFFAPNQFMYFDLQRLAAFEKETGRSVLNFLLQIEESSAVGISFIVAACRAGLAHHYSNKPGVMEDVLDTYIEDGGMIYNTDFLMSISHAFVASGIFGKKMADKAVKNEIDKIEDDEPAEDTAGKNAKKPVKK